MTLDKKELGEKVKEARKIKGQKINKKYTGQMLADDVDISRSYLGDIESGRIYPSYRILSKIANACDVPLSFFGDADSLLKEIIERHYPNMDDEKREDFINYVKYNMNSPIGLIDWDLDVWKERYDNFKISQETCEFTKEEIDAINEWEAEEREKYSKHSFADEIKFKTPEAAMTFILKQPSIMGFGGFDASKMSDDEIMEFANELLNQLKLLGYKYNK